MTKKHVVLLMSALLIAGAACVGPNVNKVDAPRGYILAIGGGDRPEKIMKRFVDLAVRNGKKKIVVFTMASGVPEETGPALIEEMKTAGATDVVRYHLSREEAMKPGTAAILDGAGGVFFSGGDQVKFMAVVLDSPIHRKLEALYREGAVLGGTSAGTAVMSEVMITGDEKRKVEPGDEWTTMEPGNVVTARGLGLIRNAVVDQHFLKRRRIHRLISVVLEHPELIGVGMDEPTALLVRPDGRFEMLGDTQITIIDARRAAIKTTSTNKLGAFGIQLHVLVDGDVYDPATGKLESR